MGGGEGGRESVAQEERERQRERERTYVTEGGAHPHGVEVAQLLVAQVDHGAGPVHGKVHGDDDAVAVQQAGALLPADLELVGHGPPPHVRIVVRLGIAALRFTNDHMRSEVIAYDHMQLQESWPMACTVFV